MNRRYGKLMKVRYELYKLEWKKQHVTPQLEQEAYDLYCNGIRCTGMDPARYTFADFVEEHGYLGERWLSFESFCAAEGCASFPAPVNNPAY